MEPAFTVKGDSAITKDIKVNVEMIKDNGTSIATAFYNGESYAIDNEDVLRYKIYISYKNNFYWVGATDNIHGKIKGEPLNEIVISKEDNAILALYRPMMNSQNASADVLEPAVDYFKDVPAASAEKEKKKFTTLYK